MKVLTLTKFLLILILPFLLFLIFFDYFSFNGSFYKERFSEYKIQQDVYNATSLHEKVINFVKGKNNELPGEFNDREKQHLLDVRKILNALTILLYILIAMFILLVMIAGFSLKVNNHIINFVGKILVFGGVLTILLAALLFFLTISDFSSTFESFHKLFFEKGTYIFDPAKEIIVRLYPEQLFMDLGLRISKGVIISSVAVILLGILLLFKSKKQKNK